MDRNSGMLKTHGEALGELKDISKYQEKLTCALSLNATHILWLIIQEELLKFDCLERSLSYRICIIKIYANNFFFLINKIIWTPI